MKQSSYTSQTIWVSNFGCLDINIFSFQKEINDADRALARLVESDSSREALSLNKERNDETMALPVVVN